MRRLAVLMYHAASPVAAHELMATALVAGLVAGRVRRVAPRIDWESSSRATPPLSFTPIPTAREAEA